MVKQRSATRLVFGWLSLRRTVMVMLLLLTGHLSSSGQGLPNLLLHDRELRSEYGSYVGNQRLAISYHKGLLLVPGRVNDRAGYFLLDTGAPFLLINEVVEDPGADVAQGLQGAVQLGTRAYDWIDWGMKPLEQVEVSHADLSHLHDYTGKAFLGILGYEAFAGQQVSIDYRNREIYFSKSNQPVLHLKGAPAFEWHFRQVGHIMLVEATLQGKKCYFILDTGSVNSVLDAREAALLTAVAQTDREVMLGSVDSRQLRTRYVQVQELAIQGQVYRELSLLPVDLSEVSKTLETQVSGIIGNDILSQYTVAIDYKEKKIRFW
jgi:predicted aspartyl protease